MHRSISAVMALAAAATAAPAGAQSVTTFDAITVTGTKTPHARDDVPASIDTVGPEELEQRAPQSLDDVLRTMPGVETSGGPRRVGETPNIRGMEGQRVVVTVDGARQNFNAGHKGRIFLDPDLLKRVEVLKGPNSSIHGSGAIGGVVALTTRDAGDFLLPGETAGARVKYGYSSAAREPLYSATAFGRIFDGDLDVLAHGAFRRTGTLVLGGGDELGHSAEDLDSGLLKVGINPAPHHRMELSVQRFAEDGQTPLTPESIASSPSSLADRTTDLNTVTLNYDYANPADTLFDVHGVAYRTEVNVGERRLSDGRFDESDLTTEGFDIYNTTRLDPEGTVAHALTYGVEYFHDEQAGERNGVARPEFPASTAAVLGLYLQDEITVLKDVSLIPAVRFDAYNQESDQTGQHKSENAVSPRIGAVWRALPWASLYGNYGRAFRAPSLTELFVSGTHFPGNTFIPNPDLDPEKSEGYELGTRLRFDDVLVARDRLRASVAYFDTQYEDFIELIVGPTTTTNRNLTEASVSGVEAEIGYDAPWWFASIGLSRLRGENDTNGEPIESMPADKAVVTLGARAAPWDTVFGIRSEFADEQDRVASVTASGAAPAERTGGYAVHGLFASWQPDDGPLRGLRVDAGIENLFDKSYRRHLSSIREVGRDYRAYVSYTRAF